jgi:hypothetical protein
MNIALGEMTLADLRMALQRALLPVARTETVSVTSNLTTDTPFLVSHSLGRRPDSFSFAASADVNVYYQPGDLTEWNARSINLRCTGAGVPLLITLTAR